MTVYARQVVTDTPRYDLSYEHLYIYNIIIAVFVGNYHLESSDIT